MTGAPSGMAEQILAFCEELRSEEVAIGTSEIQDAFHALEIVPWTSPVDFKEALATTIAKSPKDREIFDLVFDRHFFRATEEAALEYTPEGAEGRSASLSDQIRDELSMEALADAIRKRKCGSIERADSDLVASANPGCSMHLAAAGVAVCHPMQILDRAFAANPAAPATAR